MGIIAWIILGLIAGMVARMLVPGKDTQGLIVTLVLGVAGALVGGFVATQLFNVPGIQGFFDLSTWITAIAGASVLLLAYNMLAGRKRGLLGWRSGRGAGRR